MYQPKHPLNRMKTITSSACKFTRTANLYGSTKMTAIQIPYYLVRNEQPKLQF